MASKFTYHHAPDGNLIELFTELDVVKDEAKGYFVLVAPRRPVDTPCVNKDSGSSNAAGDSDTITSRRNSFGNGLGTMLILPARPWPHR